MKFKNLWAAAGHAVKSIFDKNERLANNIVDDKPATTFPLDFRRIQTGNSGVLLPIMMKEVLPGDIWEINASSLIRQSNPSAATMESAVCDTYFFVVPRRLTDPYWKEFFGENSSAGPQLDVKTCNQIHFKADSVASDFSYNQDDVAAYLGIPQKENFLNDTIISAPFSAYIQIYNDYFRDENLQSEVIKTYHASGVMPDPRNLTYDVNTTEWKSNDYRLSLKWGKGLAPACKLNDVFTTCLPWPQKGDAVDIGSLFLNNLVVKNNLAMDDAGVLPAYKQSVIFTPSWYDATGNFKGNKLLGVSGNGRKTGTYNSSVLSYDGDSYLSLSVVPTSADPYGNPVQSFTLNDFRLAAVIQQMRELDARGGTRYNEYILNHFGIDLKDSTSQRAQYIGGWRQYLDTQNIVQSSADAGAQSIGMLGGVSVNSSLSDNTISYAATEHAIIMGICVIRPQINYCQGLDKFYRKNNKLEYFDPLLENIGEQPVYAEELKYVCRDAEISAHEKRKVFGYQEAWYEYKYAQNEACGYMSVDNPLSLASLYIYTQKYSTQPVLSDEFIKSDKDIIGNTLKLNGGKLEFIHQYIIDYFFQINCTRTMKAYAIPGLKRV